MRSIEEIISEEVSVHAPGMWENELTKAGINTDWWAVSNDKGIIAYFGEESDAELFQLQKAIEIQQKEEEE